MSKQKRNTKVSEYRQYPVLTISRSMIREQLGDKIAEQMTDAKLKAFADALHGIHSDDKELWQEILENYFEVDF